MHKTIVAVGAAAILLLAGCGTEEKRLEGELSLATARVTELEQAVSQSGMRADSLLSHAPLLPHPSARLNPRGLHHSRMRH